MAKLLKLQLKAEGPTPKVEISRNPSLKIDYTQEYAKLDNDREKSVFLKGLLNNKVLLPATINSPEAQKIIAFLNKPEIQKDLIGYGKDSLKETIKKIPPTVKEKIEAFSGKKIEIATQKTMDTTNGLVKSASELEQSNLSGKRVTHEEHRGHKRNFEARKEENERNIKRHKELELKPNKTTAEEFEYQKLEKDIQRFKVAYQKYKERANKSGVDTTDLDHLLVNLKIFQAKELFPVVQGRDFPITDISESSQNSSINNDPSLQNSQTAKKLYETLNQLISDIRGSKVRELLAEARKAIESEIKKIDEAKAEFRSELKKIEEGNATNKKELISALEKKLTEKVKGSLDAIKNKLLDVTKNLNIDSGSLEKAVGTVTQKLQNIPKNLSPEEKVNFQTNLVMTMMIALLDKAKEQSENEIQPNDVQKIKQTIEQKFDDIMKVAATPNMNIKLNGPTQNALSSIENGFKDLQKAAVKFIDDFMPQIDIKNPMINQKVGVQYQKLQNNKAAIEAIDGIIETIKKTADLKVKHGVNSLTVGAVNFSDQDIKEIKEAKEDVKDGKSKISKLTGSVSTKVQSFLNTLLTKLNDDEKSMTLLMNNNEKKEQHA